MRQDELATILVGQVGMGFNPLPMILIVVGGPLLLLALLLALLFVLDRYLAAPRRALLLRPTLTEQSWEALWTECLPSVDLDSARRVLNWTAHPVRLDRTQFRPGDRFEAELYSPWWYGRHRIRLAKLSVELAERFDAPIEKLRSVDSLQELVALLCTRKRNSSSV
ncbi:MAG TPA: hypothetical protein VGE52_21065 [Pirellulales bacterium]